MTAAMKPCICPESVEVDVPIDGPIRCACCGELLELTCAGACGKVHVARSFDVARRTLRAQTPALIAKPERRKETKPRTYQPKPCACGATFQPTGPRDIRCESCKSVLIPAP